MMNTKARSISWFGLSFGAGIRSILAVGSLLAAIGAYGQPASAPAPVLNHPAGATITEPSTGATANEVATASPTAPVGIVVKPGAAFSTPVGAAGLNMTWQGGLVQHTQKVYTIFWNPPGTSFPSGYQATINQFVQDLNGTSFYGIASQYGDGTGPISKAVLFGGTWVDTVTPIPSSFLTNQDVGTVITEVNHAKAVNGWPSDVNSYFQVYTPSNVTSLQFCGYHSYASNFTVGLILYPTDCTWSPPWPNSGPADGAINVSSHEIMETVTDPFLDSWYNVDSGEEIGDLCAWTFGTRDSTGGNTVLNGHHYLLQQEWSNATSSCVLSYGVPTPPAAPSGLSAVALSSTSARVSWTDNSNNETGFVVNRWNGSAWVAIATVGANVTSYTDASLQPGTTYYHAACAQNSAGTVCSATDSVVTTPGTTTAPAAPSGLSGVALSSTSARISWVDNSNNETAFVVIRWNGSAWVPIATLGANVTTYTDTSLQPGTTYYHAACAQNSAGTVCSATDSIVTTPGTTTPPAAPSGLSAVALSSTSARISWADNSNNETAFVVIRWNGSAWVSIATLGANVTSYTDASLQPGTTYYHAACAQNSAGTVCSATDSVVTTPGTGLPAPPSGLSAVALSSTSARISWADNSSNETAFVVIRWNGSAWVPIATLGANVTSYTDASLQPGTTYYHAACAQNSAGTVCSATDSVVTTPGAGMPAPPSGLSAVLLSSTSARISWTDNSNNETGFVVIRWNGSAWVPIATLGANVTSYTDTSLQAHTTYYHAACAQNGVGTVCSATDSVVTTP